MSAYSTAFLEIVDKNLLDLTDRRIKTISDWVLQGQFTVNGPVLSSFALCTPIDGIGLSSAFAEEISKLSLASIETLISISKINGIPRSSAWLFIKLYYSAFYAAHSLLRLSGRSFSQLKAQQAGTINLTASSKGNLVLSNGLTAGYYMLSQVKAGKGKFLVIEKKRDSSSGGSHASLWETFYALLEHFHASAAESKAIPATDRLDTVRFITHMKLALKSGGQKPSWLTGFRNSINYRFSHDLWFPYKKRQAEIDSYFRLTASCLNRRFSDFESQMNMSYSEVQRALSLCASIISLNLSTLDLISQRSSSGIFMNRGMLDRRASS